LKPHDLKAAFIVFFVALSAGVASASDSPVELPIASSLGAGFEYSTIALGPYDEFPTIWRHFLAASLGLNAGVFFRFVEFFAQGFEVYANFRSPGMIQSVAAAVDPAVQFMELPYVMTLGIQTRTTTLIDLDFMQIRLYVGMEDLLQFSVYDYYFDRPGIAFYLRSRGLHAGLRIDVALFQILGRQGYVFVDIAHNPFSAGAAFPSLSRIGVSLWMPSIYSR
jgi:hypothetical protein